MEYSDATREPSFIIKLIGLDGSTVITIEVQNTLKDRLYINLFWAKKNYNRSFYLSGYQSS